MNEIKYEYNRGKAHVSRIRNKLREEKLRWCKHVLRRKNNYGENGMIEVDLPKRKRPNERYEYDER